jgi:hypothetical protein
VRDDFAADDSWHNLQDYLQRYRFQRQYLAYSHTFCPACFLSVQRDLCAEADQMISSGAKP